MSAPRSGRGGRRFKSCHSDQYLDHLLRAIPTDSPTEIQLDCSLWAKQNPLPQRAFTLVT
jgi:hypothetical protein